MRTLLSKTICWILSLILLFSLVSCQTEEEQDSRRQCPFCQSYNAASAAYCSNCGEALNKKRECPECGCEAPQGAKYCAGCGASLKEQETVEDEESLPNTDESSQAVNGPLENPNAGIYTSTETYSLKETQTLPLSVTYVPLFANDDTELFYESSDPSVVSVDEDGVLTAGKPGTATVTISNSDGKYSKTVSVEVVKQVWLVKSRKEIVASNFSALSQTNTYRYFYNNEGKNTRIDVYSPQEQKTHKYTFTYDENGNKLTHVFSDLYNGDTDDREYEYTYDENGNLSQTLCHML